MENPLLVLSRFRYPGLVKASPTFCSDSKRKKEMRQSLCEEMLLELTSGKCALIPFPFVFKNESNFDCAGNIRVARKASKEFHTKIHKVFPFFRSVDDFIAKHGLQCVLSDPISRIFCVLCVKFLCDLACHSYVACAIKI